MLRDVRLVPAAGDLLIRTTPATNEHSHFVVVDPETDRVVLGPYASLDEAFRHARDSVNKGCIWQQILDDRGRPLGPATRLDIAD
jgi:hypothetical protein